MKAFCNSPITNQICSRNGGICPSTRTHFFGLPTFFLVRVVPTVVLTVALQSSIYTSSFGGNKASWWSCTCFLEQALKDCTYLLDYKINRHTSLNLIWGVVVKKLMKITTAVTGELLFTVERLNPTFLGGMTGSFLCKGLTTLFPPELSRPQNRTDSELYHTQYTHT